MTRKVRLIIATLCALLIAPALAVVIMHIPEFGHHALPYGDAINHTAGTERHVTNMVSAVNFDYRAFDTLGEELMLVAAVTGTLVLLRGRRGESLSDQAAQAGNRPVCERSEAVTLACRFFLPIIIAFGIYVILHAQLTPGGGFQGGVIMASAAVFLYLAGQFAVLRRVSPNALLEAADSLGAGGYVLIGLAGLASGAAFLQNILPLGPVGQVYSAGTIWAISIAVGLEVSAAFVLLMLEFLEQTLEMRQRRNE